MKKTNITLFVFMCLLLVLPLSAQNDNVVKYGNDFLAIGVGARAHGMGKSVVANVSGGDAGYWNPAGLVMSPSAFQVNFMHAEWFAGVAKYDYISIANSLGDDKKATLGISLIRLGVDNIPNTFDLVMSDGSIDPSRVTSFSYADYAGLVSYSRKLKPKGLRLGGTAKVIYKSAGKFGSAWGFGADLGMQYDIKRWKFGLMARDITSTFNAWSYDFTEEEIATLVATGNEIVENSIEVITPRIILGTAFSTRRTGAEKVGILVEMDLDFTTDGQRNVLVSTKSFNMDPSLGMEFDYKNIVFIRGGINNFQNVLDDEGNSSLAVQPNMGIGIKIGSFNIDYALNNVGSAGNTGNFYSHIVSVAINFKQKNGNKEQLDKGQRQPKAKEMESKYPDYIEQID
jgi:hypothetical protein